MTSHRPADELSEEEHEVLLRREREKLAALLRRQNAGGSQYRLASLLIVVTLLAGFFAWMRTWNAETRWSFITGLTILSIVFGMPIVVVWLIRSRFMIALSYFWSVLIAQLVMPTLVVYGLCHSDTAMFVRAALIFVTSTVVCVVFAGLLVRCVSSRDKSEFVKAAYIGALWPLGMPPLIGIWIGLWRGDLSVFFVEVIGLYSAAAEHFPLTIIACGVTTAASCMAMAFRETAGQPLLK